MPTFLTIDNTTKSGYITIFTNDLYPTLTNKKEKYILKDKIGEITLLDDNDGNHYIEVQISGRKADEGTILLSNDVTKQRYYPVSAVNSVAITDLDDLKTKLLALL